MSTLTATRGRLIFDSGAANLTFRGSSSIETLYQAEFTGQQPDIKEYDGGEVHIRYPQTGPFGWLRNGLNSISGVITLNTSVPWDIECRGGLADLTAELQSVQVRSFTLHGGASGLRLSFGPAEGVVPIHVMGGMSNLNIERPRTVPVRLRVHGGAASVSVDDQRFGAMGGHLDMRSGDTASAHGSYEVEINGGASSIRIAPAND